MAVEKGALFLYAARAFLLDGIVDAVGKPVTLGLPEVVPHLGWVTTLARTASCCKEKRPVRVREAQILLGCAWKQSHHPGI